MTKDYAKQKSHLKKPRHQQGRKKRSKALDLGAKTRLIPAWLWLLAGLGVGLLIGLIIWRGEHAPRAIDSALSTAQNGAPVIDRRTNFVFKEAKTGEKANKPRFDFYTLLPNATRELPEKSAPEAKTHPTPPPVSTDPITYLVQAGSFREYSTAEALKARLAIQGIESKLQKMTVHGETWHRVSIGPFATKQAATAMQHKLAENLSLNSLVVNNQV